MTVGENIKKFRKERGLTQKQLGELCGINEVQIRRYELGGKNSNPKIETIQKIATALNVPLRDLFIAKIDNLGINIDLTDINDKEDINKYLSAIIPHFEENILKEKEEIERVERLIELENLENQNIEQLVDNYLKLNDLGQQEALKRVEELTEIPRYTKKEE